MAKWGAILEVSRDPLHFPDGFFRIAYELNSDRLLLIGNVQNLEMVDAVGSTSGRASGHGAVVVRPGQRYAGGETLAKESCPEDEKDRR